MELPGTVSLWEIAPAWSPTRGPPSSHTQISSAAACQPGGVYREAVSQCTVHTSWVQRETTRPESDSPGLIWHPWQTQTVRSAPSPPAGRSGRRTASRSCSVPTTHSGKPSERRPSPPPPPHRDSSTAPGCSHAVTALTLACRGLTEYDSGKRWISDIRVFTANRRLINNNKKKKLLHKTFASLFTFWFWQRGTCPEEPGEI